jgi:putative colanic acid biosynthesis UDP-glucose lipid carrier transferase
MSANTENVLGRSFYKEYTHTVLVLLRFVDILALCGAGWFANYIWYGNLTMLDSSYKITVTLGILLGILFFEFAHVYNARRIHTLIKQVSLIVQTWLSALAILAVITTQWLPEITFAENMKILVIWGGLGFIFLATARLVLTLVIEWLRANGWNQRRIVIVGLSEMAIATSRRVNDSSWTALRVIGYVDDRPSPRFEIKDDGPLLPRLGAVKDLAAIVQKERIDQVWVAYPLRGEARAQAVVHALRHVPVSIRYVIDCYTFNMATQFLSLNDVAGIPTLDISVSPLDGVNRYIKEMEDRLLALVILVLTSPLMLAIAIGVKLSSPGPVFFRQERVCWNNRPFMMLKFRSMPVDVENQSGPVWAKPGERRATPFGALLRRTSLDELPQLFNVLTGDMSLVGPRPERPAFVSVFKDQVPNYMKKHMMKAGITGWAQVNGWRGDTDLTKRIEHDLYYIQNWSIWFDLHIAMRTVTSGLLNKNAY